MSIQALIFDFDGLILETEGPTFRSWQELYQEFGCELSFEKWAVLIGTAEDLFDPLGDLEQQLGRPIDREGLAARRLQRERELIRCQTVMPGVQDYLEGARRLGLKVGLASSSSCEWVVGHLTRLGLIPYFGCIKASDDVTRTKPDPALYLQALECLKVPAHLAIAFEDSPNGVIAAKRAGLFCVAVPTKVTRRLSFPQADLCIHSLSEMPLDELLGLVERKIAQRGDSTFAMGPSLE